MRHLINPLYASSDLSAMVAFILGDVFARFEALEPWVLELELEDQLPAVAHLLCCMIGQYICESIC